MFSWWRRQRLGRFDASHPTRGTQRLLRFPILLGVLVYALFLLTLYVWTRSTVALYEYFLNVTYRKRRRLSDLLNKATSYEEWSQYARELDEFDRADEWKGRSESHLYDHNAVQSLIDRLELGIKKYERKELSYAEDMIKTLQRIYSSNLSGLGIDNEAIYAETHYGTKYLVEKFIETVVQATHLIADAPEDVISKTTKLDFFDRAIRSYGRMALCLSSGAMLANYHFGTIRSLLDQGLIPEIVSGTSGGAFVAAFVCTRETRSLNESLNAKSLHELVNLIHEPLWRMFVRYFIHGAMIDTQDAGERLRAIFGDMTFEEAYRKTGRVLCITATSRKKFGDTILLNYVSAPNVTIWSAVLSSCAVPPVLKAVQLHEKNPSTGVVEPFTDFGLCWTDGAFKSDVPRKALSETFNVNYLVVSQVNPHIIPFFFEHRGSSGSPSIRRVGSSFKGGFILSSLEVLIRFELLKILQYVDEFDLLPELFSADFSRVFLQSYSGNVTIYPKRG